MYLIAPEHQSGCLAGLFLFLFSTVSGNGDMSKGGWGGGRPRIDAQTWAPSV